MRNGESVGSNADAIPKPDPSLLSPHLFAGHDLIPLHRPNAVSPRSNKPLGKAPRDEKWPDRDYSGQDPRQWMVQGFNVGVRLRANQLVVDVDPRKFGGTDSLAELCKLFGIKLGDFPYVLSGGGLGGRHIYMTKPSGAGIGRKLDAFPGIDFMARGTQLVAAGSVHPETGRLYRADDPFGELLNPPTVPDGLLNALVARSSARPVSETTASISNEELAQLLAVLSPTNYSDYDAWLKLMMACHHATGGSGIEEFIAWSVLDPDYAHCAAEISEKWGTLSLERGIAVRAPTLFKAVVEAGHPELVARVGRGSPERDFAILPAIADVPGLKAARDGRPAPTLANCLKLLEHANFGLSYDELARRHVLRAEKLPWSIDIGRELNDDMIRVIRHCMIVSAGMEFSKENVAEACLTLGRQSPFNPVVDYLASLRWDGTPRIDEWLVRYFGASDSEYTRAIGRLVLLGAVRRARKPGCKFDYVLILEGTQGTGKSTALKLLGGDWYSDAELGRLDNKEAPLVLQSVWIHEIGELTAMGRSEVEDLKAFVSRCEDRFRTPFDRMAHSDPRRCVFIGTTNASTYLFDETGNRRFWPVKTTDIDLAALARDRDQLWAEAAAAEAAGESILLAPHLWAVAAEEQSERLADDPWKDRIQAWLDGELVEHSLSGPERGERRDRVHTRDLFNEALGIEAGRQNQHMAKRLKDVMRSIGGWTYKRGLRIEGIGSGAGYQRDEP